MSLACIIRFPMNKCVQKGLNEKMVSNKDKTVAQQLCVSV